MMNLKFQVEKQAKAKKNPKSILLDEYHKLPEIFFTKNSDIFSFY